MRKTFFTCATLTYVTSKIFLRGTLAEQLTADFFNVYDILCNVVTSLYDTCQPFVIWNNIICSINENHITHIQRQHPYTVKY